MRSVSISTASVFSISVETRALCRLQHYPTNALWCEPLKCDNFLGAKGGRGLLLDNISMRAEIVWALTEGSLDGYQWARACWYQWMVGDGGDGGGAVTIPTRYKKNKTYQSERCSRVSWLVIYSSNWKVNNSYRFYLFTSNRIWKLWNDTILCIRWFELW